MNKTRKIEITVELIRIVAAVAIAYAIALLTLVVFSDEPVYIIQQFILGPFSSMRRLGSVINLAIPFTFTGLCFCFMYAVNKFNLAGEGTFMVSGCLTALVAIKIGDTLPPVVMIPLLLCVGALVGIILNAIPALLDIKFNANIVKQIASVGQMTCIGAVVKKRLASLAKVPQLALGAGIPIPKKPKNASLKIALGTSSVTDTMIGPMLLTTRCLNKIRLRLAPSTKAARENSCSFSVMTCVRT